MFISVSGQGDSESAPPGSRAVMISTHGELALWQGLFPEAYEARKREVEMRLISLARRVYPTLGQQLANSNQRAVPHDIGVPGFWLAGDSTWPGLGTVACVLGSRIVARGVMKRAGLQAVDSQSTQAALNLIH
ncbi:hypothetical protein [Pyxidicoccus trucidator]|uniref:hypothetical protein n=1 Tax=Pyxidicoccus trucidator TaxID=2709662 RepID=UPI0013DA71C5|nr:hypothetical protein [Pyxidicoccus trucidator]